MASRNRQTAIFTKLKQRASKGPRKKRIRPEPRQYTITDLERARDRVEAAERRVDSDHTDQLRSAGLERAQRELKIRTSGRGGSSNNTLKNADASLVAKAG